MAKDSETPELLTPIGLWWDDAGNVVHDTEMGRSGSDEPQREDGHMKR
jgi:hypothetical protein